MGYTCRLGVSCCHYNLEILRTRCAVNLGKEDFVRTEYRASLGGVMRTQGFALSKMKADSEKSAKFKIWGTQH